MATILDYLAWRGDLSFDSCPFNEVDGLALARLSYARFELDTKRYASGVVSIADAAAHILSLPDIDSKLLLKNDGLLLAALGESERFRDMKLFGYADLVDSETQTQFSAITIQMGDYQYYVSFRGTDNTLVGWKENFNMSFVCPVPAQKLAVAYLNDLAEKVEGRFLLGGHSKGGNLAVYAAAFCNPSIQSRIDAVYNFDGPGFDEKVLHEPSYDSICGIAETFLPQTSIVGMLLGHEEKYTIVHSTQANWFLQHDIYSWEVQRDHFIRLQNVTNGSRVIDYTLKEWLAGMDYSQREQFVDAIYMILRDTNVQTLRELSEKRMANTRAVLKAIKTLDEPTQQSVKHALHLLLKSAKKNVFQMLQIHQTDTEPPQPSLLRP